MRHQKKTIAVWHAKKPDRYVHWLCHDNKRITPGRKACKKKRNRAALYREWSMEWRYIKSMVTRWRIKMDLSMDINGKTHNQVFYLRDIKQVKVDNERKIMISWATISEEAKSWKRDPETALRKVHAADPALGGYPNARIEIIHKELRR